ncbi:TonB-dependent receptor [Acinetobacter chinensis]|uniref:TonB-dependent receptor n=1 Tax=Acinetobacter chinensis TaxID=2004650 RepID=A0A3B7M0I3_9GAMM|nr:TonB-dependent receptor [Acinetobacter chinensis]
MALKEQQKKRLINPPEFRKTSLSFVVAAMLYSSALHAQNVVLDLPSQPLQQSIQQLARQSGIEIIAAAQQVQTRTAPKIKGNMSVDQALETMLQGSGLTVKKQANIYVIVEKNTAVPLASANPASSSISEVPDGQAAVQMEAITVYGDKDRDTQGYDNVYDKNRSSVYAGKEYVERFKGTNPADVVKGMVGVYSGDARNSGALDPSVRGVQGVGRVPLTIDGTEQSIAVWRGYNGVNNRNYIDPNLIGGIEVIKGPSLERGATTSVGGGVLVKTLEADDIVRSGKTFGAEIKLEGSNNSVKPSLPTLQYVGQNYNDIPPWTNIGGALYDPDIYKQTKTKSDNKLFSGNDVAGRIALAAKQDKFDLLAVYAERERGNYFSGTHNSDFYNKAEPTSSMDYIPYFAHVYVPGGEVTNTSSHMTSWLLKGTYRPTDDQSVKLTYRQTKNEYGEILPSRIQWFVTPETGVPQWPLSVVDSKAYSLDYKYNPEDNRWVDFAASLWQTDTESNTYTRGGWPTVILPETKIIANTAVAHSDNTRKGVNLSNKINLLNNLDLSLGASLLKEKLSSDDIYKEHGTNVTTFQALPRAGRREEKNFDFNFNYRPTDWLTFEAGMRYRNYWAFDDFLNKNLGASNLSNQLKHKTQLLGYTYDYYTMPEVRSSFNQLQLQIFGNAYKKSNPDWNGDYTSVPASSSALYNAIWSQKNTLNWSADENGKMHWSDNVINSSNLGVEGKDYILLNNPGRSLTQSIPITEVTKTKDSAWAPQLSAAIRLNDHNRIYLRYAEEYRMPSLFESTVGFSANLPYSGLKPEHTFNTEFGYIYDARNFFKTARYADIKLAYFHHRTENVIERDKNLIFTNMEQQTLSGLELQSRFDNGRFFTDLSLAYNLKNKVCDEDNAVKQYFSSGVYKKCVDDGFPNGYLVTMATPELSFNGLFGVRLLDEQLELGARATYYKGYESYLRKNGDLDLNAGYYLNVPLAWDDTWLFDAYANYRINEQATVELVSNNITNQYYIDPLTRSAMAAPGRTIKMGLTYKF